MMPIKFGTFINDNEVKKTTDINGLYGLMQFINTTSGYDNLTADVISEKLGELISATTASATASTTSPTFEMIAPSNASNSCWLNSILMAYLVPLYVMCGSDFKTNINFDDSKQYYIVDLIHKYIDAHFEKKDRNDYDGFEIIKDIKKYLVKPTVIGHLNENYYLVTPDGTNNQHTFLYNDQFRFHDILNNSKQIHLGAENMNVVPLNINATKMEITDSSLVIDNRTYNIDQEIHFITFQSETPGDFSQSVQDFLKPEITVGGKTFEQVSFVLADRGHFVVVVKNNKSTNTYSMINDLPPTIKDVTVDEVQKLISKRSDFLDGYYVVGIVYMLKDYPCNNNNPSVDVQNKELLASDTKSALFGIEKAKQDFKKQIEDAIALYTTDQTNDRNKAQVVALTKLLEKEFPPKKTAGGSRKTLGPKSKKTKRKYYVYKK
jgi:hypothetical protein